MGHELLEYRYMDDVTGNLFNFLFKMAGSFENTCEIVSD